MLTAVQSVLTQGFNASLRVRGVGLTGPRNFACTALIDWDSQSVEFEVADEQRQLAEVHVLNTVPGVFDIEAGDVLKDRSGRRFTVFRLKRIGLKVVFGVLVEDAAAPREQPAGTTWTPSQTVLVGEGGEEIIGEGGENIGRE